MKLNENLTKRVRLAVRILAIGLAVCFVCAAIWVGYSFYKRLNPTHHNGLGCAPKSVTSADLFAYTNDASTTHADKVHLVTDPNGHTVQYLVESFVETSVSAHSYSAKDFDGKEVTTVVFTCERGREVIAHTVHLDFLDRAILFQTARHGTVHMHQNHFQSTTWTHFQARGSS